MATRLHVCREQDAGTLRRLLAVVDPHEVYVVATSSGHYPMAECVQSVVRLTRNWLRAIRDHGSAGGHRVRFILAVTAAVFGAGSSPFDETSPVRPTEPEGVAMANAWEAVARYRDRHGVHASTAILLDHESERQGEGAVSRTVTRAATRIRLGLQPHVVLGGLDGRREWGYAADHAEAMWRMAQQERADDYVIATGDAHTTRGFVSQVFGRLGLAWRDHVVVREDATRSSEAGEAAGDASKARRSLGWQPNLPFDVLIERMINHDISLARREKATGVAGP